MATYREILSEVLEKTSPSFFDAQPMPRNLMLMTLVPEQTGVVLTTEECNLLAPVFQKLIDGTQLNAADNELLDQVK